MGSDIWSKAYREHWDISRATGINIGVPACYYALRMLNTCLDWRQRKHDTAEPVASATLTIVLVGKAKGTQPRTSEELEAGRGNEVQRAIDPQLRQNDYATIRQSLWLFSEYVEAATQGGLGLRLNFVDLPALELPIRVSHKGFRFAGLADQAWTDLWNTIPAKDRAITDWWWVIYPSAVPEQHPDFATTEFITGGMGTGPDDMSPCFIIDDRWLTRKPPHLGKGPYSDIERRAYLPQWLQHEFFHHLYRIYPEHKLEVKGHDWFDRKAWPADFEVELEPDYYAESLGRRFLGSQPPLAARLLYAPPSAELLGALKIDQILGAYRHEPPANDWHRGAIEVEPGGSGKLRWTNAAGVSWHLAPDLAHGLLKTGPDCPYYRVGGAPDFRVVLKRGADGRHTTEIEGFTFQGGLYKKQK